MNDSRPGSLRQDVAALVVRHLAVDPEARHPATTLPLAVPSFGAAEVAEAIQVLLTGWITMGPRVASFESAWSAYVGASQGVMVNSGSSALLVLFSGLVSTGLLRRGDEVLVPAVGWPTALFAVAQAGLVPVVVDVDPDSLCIEGKRDRATLAVHLLGCPSRVQAPLVIEEACGAHGARVGAQPVGSLGIAAAFSFFFSHHITTGEGGMITTSHGALADACRSLRAHGWTRERRDRQRVNAQHREIDPRFLFVEAGFNVRPTELAGAFGVHQARRAERFVSRRNTNHREWCERIAKLGLPVRVFPELPGTRHAAFGFPLLLSERAPLSRARLCAHLEARGIETRPISGANITRQPAFQKVPGARVEGDLPVADAVHDRGLFVGQSHAFGPEHGELLAQALADALG